MATTTDRHGGGGGPVESHGAFRTHSTRRGVANPDTTGRVTHDRIEARAYEVYRARERDGGTGDAVSDWLQAERELSGAVPDPSAATDIEFKAQVRGERLLAGVD